MPGLRTLPPTRPIYRRLAVVTEGTRDIYRNKTALNLLRFRPEDVVCVIDSNHAGSDFSSLPGIDAKIPVVGSLRDAMRLGIDWLVIGVNTPGGYLPDSIRPHVYEAIRNRIGVISGLHESVNGDPNLVSLAARYAVDLVNLRATPDDRMVSTGLARGTKAFRLLTVGTDANIGKTTVALTLVRHLNATKAYATKARFVSTSQDGILISGRGVAVDRMISDFAGGMVEHLVLGEDHKADILVIEGQNSILSPCYSGTSISLVHGSCPDAMILCHNPKRVLLRHTDAAVPPLATYIDLYERVLAPIHPGKVVAIALNTLELSESEAQAAIAAAEKETGLPVADVIREGAAGCARIVKAVLAAKRAKPVYKPKKAVTATRAANAAKAKAAKPVARTAGKPVVRATRTTTGKKTARGTR
jgi:uncharacterized NAD-dependent epimerase/dehydratase family protein